MNTHTSPEPHVVEHVATTTAVIRDVVDVAALADFFDRSFSTLPTALASQGATILGPAFARYYRQPTDTADVEVGFTVDRAIEPDDTVHAGSLPGGQVARMVHHGSYDELGSSWERLRAWIDAQGLTPAQTIWEVYVTEPSPDMNPADLRTELNWSLAPSRADEGTA